MAIVKFGMIIVDMRGKLGGHVLAKNRGGSYARTKVTPLNPQTGFQMKIRAIFTTITQAWSSLTENQRNSFRVRAPLYSSKNIFGDSKVPSGKELHQRLNENLIHSGQAILTEALPPIPVPASKISGVAIAPGFSFEIELDGDSTGSRVQVFASSAVTKGTEFVRHKLRLLTFRVGTDQQSIDILSEYTQRFGAPVSGDKIFIGIKFINAQGQASPMETLSAIAQ